MGRSYAGVDWASEKHDVLVADAAGEKLLAATFAHDEAGLRSLSPELAVLTENYLKPWLDAGYPRTVTDRSLSLALRVAPLARALTWGRLFPCYLGHPGPAAHAVRALAAMLKPSPLT